MNLNKLFTDLCAAGFIDGALCDFTALCRNKENENKLRWIKQSPRKNGLAKRSFCEMIMLLFALSPSKKEDMEKIKTIYNNYFAFDEDFEHSYIPKGDSRTTYYDELKRIIKGS